MAVALRSHSDLVYLPDHGYTGETGAIRILLHIDAKIRRIDISHNLLNPTGLRLLLAGLANTRGRLSTRDTVWGMREMNLAVNDLDDASFLAALEYAKKDVCMEKLLLQGNRITMSTHTDAIIHALNSSRLSFLSLNQNALSSASTIKFFDTLNAPHLTELHMSTCSLDATSADSIARYLASPRARSLIVLELNANALGGAGCRRIVDAVEGFNYTIRHLGLFANETTGLVVDNDEAGGDVEVPTNGPSGEERARDESILRYTVHERLPPILERNRTLTKRIRSAASRALVPARIILRARHPSDTETAQQVIHHIGERQPLQRGLPILDLPREVVYHIVRHTSGDHTAFSGEQWVKLVKYAEDEESCKETAKRVREAESRYRGNGHRAVREVMEGWLRFGGWDHWDLDRPLGEFGEDGPDRAGTWVELS